MSEFNSMDDTTRGLVYIHCAPRLLVAFIEGSIRARLEAGDTFKLHWVEQPARQGCVSTKFEWVGAAGTGLAFASDFVKLKEVYADVTEDPTELNDGQRCFVTPSLGLWTGRMSVSGDILLNDNRIKHLMNSYEGDELTAELHKAMGTQWDTALENMRASAHQSTSTIAFAKAS